MPLPIRLAAEFPPELVATPIEDIDPYYANKKTFVVISKVNTTQHAACYKCDFQSFVLGMV